MFATFLHLLKGTPYIFQGEEIGLINTPVTSIEEIDDIETVNFYNERVSENYSNDAIFSSINKKGRDNLRRPMQWDSTENAGFTKGKPWLALNPNYSSINVLQDQQSKNSIFTYYKKLIQLRKENELVVYGEYKELVPEDKQLYAYERSYNGETWLIVLNFYKKETVYKDSQQRTASIVISNYPDSSDNLSDLKLRPFESIVFKLNERYQK